ncbi:virulence protein [Desulfosporosinus sp. Tol-M]|nr:virulence protein [Desulfosporosinus sp. Tol-M]
MATIKFNVAGAERKRLVGAISEITGAEGKYLGMPSAAYQVDCFTIDRNGAVSFDDRADSEDVDNLLVRLADQGFEPEPSENSTVGNSPAGGEQCFEDGEDTGLAISLPLDKVSVDNLAKLLDAKGSLISKALGIPATPIEVNEDTISFPWFDRIPCPDEVSAYSRFIIALCAMSKKQKRINATEKEVENEKYAFRCFLLRLGFIGEPYKKERKILLRNLTGSSAFKGGVKDAVSK